MTSDDLFEMPFLRNIGLVMTYRCQVACPHCILEAGPERKEEILLSDAVNWIQQIANYRHGYIKGISLTGGEPFYNIEKLKNIAAFAEKSDLLVSAITNAFWATTKEEAIRVLRELKEIEILAFSTDVYHQESIPFERVKNAILAAKECNIPYNIAVCTENENDTVYKEILCKLEEITEKDNIKTSITFPVGRALKKLGTFKYKTSEIPPVSACTACSSPIIFPDGRVIACIGPLIDLSTSHPLVLGNLRINTLNEILDNAESNPILQTIRIWGPRKLVSLIKEAGLHQYLPQRYIEESVCDACYNLMSNSKIIEFLNQLANDYEFKRKIAYARLYYLKETKMAELYCQ